MRRRTTLALATTLTSVAALAPTLSASAAPSASGTTHRSKAVCSHAATGHARCFAHVRTKDDGITPNATTTYASGYNPAQLRKAYGLTTSSTATVAIVDAYAHPSAAVDLAAYRKQFGLGTATLTQVNQRGGATLPAGDTGWGQEEMLDLEMVSAVCPGCKILYVGADSASFANLAAAVDRAVALGAKVVSNSYGGSESSGVSTYAASYDHPGVAITVSSGDSGYGVQSPASYNTVTAVGGTNLPLDATGNRTGAETVWSGAGSGCSSYIAKPSWQHDSGCSRRTVADVSAVADPNTGVAVYDSYGSTGGANWFVFGGTSVAAPLIGGVYALSGNTAGVPAQLAYNAPTGTLLDVTSGSNGRCVKGRTSGTAYLCTGGVGYDGPTGIGTPKGTGGF